jgi:hypothetical protein
MKSTSETGRAVSVGNLEKVYASIIGLGSRYDPGNPDILPPAVLAELTNEKNALKQINIMAAPWITAVNDRFLELDPLGKLVVRAYNAAAASNITKTFLADLKTQVRKITGQRATHKVQFEPGTSGTPTEESMKQISASQMGIDNRLNHFDAFIQLLASEPNYNPNEADLKVAALTAKHAALSTKNSSVISAWPNLANARIACDNYLYHNGNSGVEIAVKIKAYYKSAYGARSGEYKQISGLKFPRKK